jgi:hypothetical protein
LHAYLFLYFFKRGSLLSLQYGSVTKEFADVEQKFNTSFHRNSMVKSQRENKQQTFFQRTVSQISANM